MPASTPTYGITYPCGGDTIDPIVLATFANTLDAALAQGVSELARVTGRPNAQVVAFAPTQPVVLNVATTLTFDTEIYDNDAMADLAVNNDRLMIQTDGAYLIWGMFATGTGAATMTSAAIILTVNAVERGRAKTRPRSGQTSTQIDLSMPMNLVAGDIIRAQALWTGTGGPSAFSTRILSASFVAAP